MEYEFLQSDLTYFNREIPRLSELIQEIDRRNDDDPDTVEELDYLRRKLKKLQAKRADTVAQLDFFEKGLAQFDAQQTQSG